MFKISNIDNILYNERYNHYYYIKYHYYYCLFRLSLLESHSIDSVKIRIKYIHVPSQTTNNQNELGKK